MDKQACSAMMVSCLLLIPVLIACPVAAGPMADPFEVMTFESAGVNRTMKMDFPRGATVTNAYMKFEGKGLDVPDYETNYDYLDRGESKAYQGVAEAWSISGPPSGYETGLFSSEEYSNIDSSDGIPEHIGGGGLGGDFIAWQHFSFKVPGNPIEGVDVYWEGLGHHNTQNGVPGYYAKTKIYDFNGSTWVTVGEGSAGETPGPEDDFVNAKEFPTDAERFVDDERYVHVISHSHRLDSVWVETDYVQLNVTVSEEFLLDPWLDVGDDGDKEWEYTGVFKTWKFTYFTEELQEHIDDAGHGPGDTSVTFAFGTENPGILEIITISIEYLPPSPPQWSPFPELELKEDDPSGQGDNLTDLIDLITDDKPVEELTFEIVYEEDPAKVNATLDMDGHHLDFTLAPDWWGEMSFRIKATDIDTLEAESSNFTVKVRSVNDPPVVISPGPQTATAGALFSLNITAYDPDSIIDTNERVAFADDTHLFDIDPWSGGISFIPLKEDVGPHNIAINVTDMEGATSQAVFGLMVDSYDGTNNHAPVLFPIDEQSVNEDEELAFLVEYSDEDEKYGDKAEFTDDTDLFDIDRSTGNVSFTPGQEDVGIHVVTITVTDLKGATGSQEVKVTVLNVNDPPTIEPIEDTSVPEGGTLNITAAAADDDIGWDEVERLSFSDDTDLFDIEPDTGRMTFEASADDIGEHEITVTVNDRHGGKAGTTFKLKVTDVNFPPVIGDIALPEDGVFKKHKGGLIDPNATDPDGDPLTYKWVTRGGNGEVVSEDPILDIKELKTGEYNLTLIVSDGEHEATKDLDFVVKKKRSGQGMPGFGGVLCIIALIGTCLALSRGHLKRRS
jgi:hypothetical protein